MDVLKVFIGPTTFYYIIYIIFLLLISSGISSISIIHNNNVTDYLVKIQNKRNEELVFLFNLYRGNCFRIIKISDKNVCRFSNYKLCRINQIG